MSISEDSKIDVYNLEWEETKMPGLKEKYHEIANSLEDKVARLKIKKDLMEAQLYIAIRKKPMDFVDSGSITLDHAKAIITADETCLKLTHEIADASKELNRARAAIRVIEQKGYSLSNIGKLYSSGYYSKQSLESAKDRNPKQEFEQEAKSSRRSIAARMKKKRQTKESK